MKKRVSKIIVLSAVSSLALTGCAIKPEPMIREDVKALVKQDLNVLRDATQPVTRPIALDEAIQRGLDHNLQKRVKLLEVALSQQQLDMVYYDMLPNLTASAGYSERNNYAASQSASFVGGRASTIGKFLLCFARKREGNIGLNL